VTGKNPEQTGKTPFIHRMCLTSSTYHSNCSTHTGLMHRSCPGMSERKKSGTDRKNSVHTREVLN